MTFFDTILEFAHKNAALLTARVIATLAVLLLTWIATRVVRSTLLRTMDRSRSTRARTLRPIVQGLSTVVISGLGIIVALAQLGLDVTAVIAGAGVLGLAVGFGAQELVKDVIAGFFLIFDGVIEPGDWVELDKTSGTVEEVGLRMTTIRSFDGKLWYIPNGLVRVVGNTNRSWMRAIVTVDLAYEQDVGRGMSVLDAVGKRWASENPDKHLEAPEVHGLLGLGASGVGARLIVKVPPGTQAGIERELRVLVKDTFDREGIEIPFGRQVVYLRQEAASA